MQSPQNLTLNKSDYIRSQPLSQKEEAYIKRQNRKATLKEIKMSTLLSPAFIVFTSIFIVLLSILIYSILNYSPSSAAHKVLIIFSGVYVFAYIFFGGFMVTFHISDKKLERRIQKSNIEYEKFLDNITALINSNFSLNSTRVSINKKEMYRFLVKEQNRLVISCSQKLDSRTKQIHFFNIAKSEDNETLHIELVEIMTTEKFTSEYF